MCVLHPLNQPGGRGPPRRRFTHSPRPSGRRWRVDPLAPPLRDGCRGLSRTRVAITRDASPRHQFAVNSRPAHGNVSSALIQSSASTASRVAQIAAESGILAFALPVRFRTFSKGNPAELEIAERLGSILPDLLMTIGSVYSWWSLGMSAMNFAQELLPDFPVQSGAIAAVVVHLESSRRRSDAEQRVMLPVQAVLAQVRGHAGDSQHEFDRAYRDTMRKVAPTASLLGRLARRTRS